MKLSEKNLLLNQITTKIGNLFILNCLFVLCNLPLVFGLLFAPWNTNNILIMILFSFTIGPSLITMLYCLNHPEKNSILKLFFSSYKLNFRKGLIISLLQTAVNLFFFFNIGTILVQNNLLNLLFPTIILMLIINLTFLEGYLFLSQFEINIKNALLNSLMCLGKYPMISLKSFILFYGYFIIVFYTHWVLWYPLYFSLPIAVLLINNKKLFSSFTQGLKANNGLLLKKPM